MPPSSSTFSSIMRLKCPRGYAARVRFTSQKPKLTYQPGRIGYSVKRPLPRSEEHTSELQSHHDLVCRLLLEKKKPRCASARNLQQSSYQHLHFSLKSKNYDDDTPEH